MAFEAIVKKQIARLKEPSIKCIDLVVQELTNVIRFVSEKVPRPRRIQEIRSQLRLPVAAALFFFSSFFFFF